MVLHDLVPWQVPLAALRSAIERLQRAGWHPAFIFMYDEAWALMRNVQQVMQEGAVAAFLRICLLLVFCVSVSADPSRPIAVAQHGRQV